MNYGVVGHQSKTEETDVADAAAAEGLMDAFAVQCAEDGYAEIPEEEQFWVVAQYALKTKDGTDRDRYLEEKAKDALISHLAWRGLGHRGPLGVLRRQAQHLLLTPDVNKAVNAIKVCIRGEDLDFTKLSIGAAAFGETVLQAQALPEAGQQLHPVGPGQFHRHDSHQFWGTSTGRYASWHAKSVQPGRTPLPRGTRGAGPPGPRPRRRGNPRTGGGSWAAVPLAGMHGMGPRTLAQLEDALDEHGLELPAG